MTARVLQFPKKRSEDEPAPKPVHDFSDLMKKIAGHLAVYSDEKGLFIESLRVTFYEPANGKPRPLHVDAIVHHEGKRWEIQIPWPGAPGGDRG